MKAVVEIQAERWVQRTIVNEYNAIVDTWAWEGESCKVWFAADTVESVTEPMPLAGQWTFLVRTRSGDETRAAYTLESTARAAARTLVDAMIHPETAP